MKKCELANYCPFFNEKMPNMPDLTSRVKEHFCLNYYQRCARYVLFKVTGAKNKDLLPTDMKKAASLLGWNLEK